MIKEKYLGTYMKTARLFAEHSSAVRKKVGAVIVKDDRIISIGYNGMPAGWDNDCEHTEFMPVNDPTEKFQDYPFLGTFWINGHNVDRRYRLRTKPEVIHAESNAIAKLAKSTESGDGASMFITCAPCVECAKMIYQSGIKEVFYGEEYRNRDGIDFLHKCGLSVTLIS